jgi:hypothetical protein
MKKTTRKMRRTDLMDKNDHILFNQLRQKAYELIRKMRKAKKKLHENLKYYEYFPVKYAREEFDLFQNMTGPLDRPKTFPRRSFTNDSESHFSYGSELYPMGNGYLFILAVLDRVFYEQLCIINKRKKENVFSTEDIVLSLENLHELFVKIYRPPPGEKILFADSNVEFLMNNPSQNDFSDLVDIGFSVSRGWFGSSFFKKIIKLCKSKPRRFYYSTGDIPSDSEFLTEMMDVLLQFYKTYMTALDNKDIILPEESINWPYNIVKHNELSIPEYEILDNYHNMVSLGFGVFVITNQRIIFYSKDHHIAYPYKKLDNLIKPSNFRLSICIR